ncbi:MAG TPA: protein kinase [Planctomycetota bacterium]|nr:protein kinase [Planctomycetota bacterium]
MSSPDRLLKTTLGGCEILEVIGKGGMGIIYRARQISLDRIVAVKVLAPKISDDSTFVQRFQREARAIARVSHPNVLQVYDVGCENDIHYMTMELVDGGNLSELQSKQGVLSPLDAAEFTIQAASGLEAAQQAGIIHRDIKPDNLMLTKKGIVKVSDFGLARDTDSAKSATDAVMGTPAYMSPEQCDGKAIDGRCDIYSLGGTFFKLVTGRLPFEAETAMSMMYRHKHEPLTPPTSLIPTIPLSISDIVVKMMAKQRQDRFQTMGEVVDALKNVCEDIRHGRGGSSSKTEETLVFNRGIDDSAPTLLPKRGTTVATVGRRGDEPEVPARSTRISSRRPGTAGPYGAVGPRPQTPPSGTPGLGGGPGEPRRPGTIGPPTGEMRRPGTIGPATGGQPSLRSAQGMFTRGSTRQIPPPTPVPAPEGYGQPGVPQPPTAAHPMGIPMTDAYAQTAAEPANVDTPQQRAALDISTGNQFFQGGDLVAAANCFNRAIYSGALSEGDLGTLQSFMHEQYEGFMKSASEFAGSQRFLEAIREYRLAALYNPNDQNIFQYISEIEGKINIKREAETSLKGAINRRDYARVGEILQTVPTELLDTALQQDVDRVVKTKLPALRQAQTARRAVEAGMFEEAADTWAQAIQLDPEAMEYRQERDELAKRLSRFDGFFRSGQDRLNKGDTRRAVNDLKVAVECYPKHPGALRALSASQLQLGLSELAKDPLRAQNWFKEALATDPGNQEAQQKLEETKARLEKEQALVRAASEAARAGKFSHAAILWSQVQQYNPSNTTAATELSKARKNSRQALIKITVALVVVAVVGFGGYRYFNETTRLETAVTALSKIDSRSVEVEPEIQEAKVILADDTTFLFNRARVHQLQQRLDARLAFKDAIRASTATPPDWELARTRSAEGITILDGLIAETHEAEDTRERQAWTEQGSLYEARRLENVAHQTEAKADKAALAAKADPLAGLVELKAALAIYTDAAGYDPHSDATHRSIAMIQELDAAAEAWQAGNRADVATHLAAAQTKAQRETMPALWTKLSGSLTQSASQLATFLADYKTAAAKAWQSQKPEDLQAALDSLKAYTGATRITAPAGVAPAEAMQGYLEDALRCWKSQMALMAPEIDIVDVSKPAPWGMVDRPEAYCIDRLESADPATGLPRVNLSYTEAEAVCRLQKKELCTQNQWQAACEYHNPVQNAFFVAASYPADDANLPCNTASGKLRPSGEQATCRNKLGLYDMSGNAEEWVVAVGPRWVLMGGGATSWSKDDRSKHASCKSENPTPDEFQNQAGVRCCALLKNMGR